MSEIAIRIAPVQTKADMKAFVEYPYALYSGEPNWRPPLRFERAAHMSPKSNPALADFDIAYFLAYRGETIAGRIAVFINEVHLKTYDDKAGHFGFFDCEASPETGAALLETAKDWILAKGMARMVGPLQWSVNDECGVLIDGFDTPPVMMMPYGRPDYQAMYEAAGFTKATDLYAFQADLNAGYPRPRQTQMMVNLADKDPDIVIRPLKTGEFLNEVRLVMDIFNDAWSENWGFIPFSSAQVTQMAKDIKPIIFKEGFWVGEIKGEPAAFIWMIPDLNSAIYDLDGKLLPFGWAKLIKRLKVSGVKQARIPLMGLRKKHHNTRKGVAVVAKLSETVFEAARNKGYTHCELSWILEDNQSMIRICEQASAKRYKTYRMYEKTL
ncbi:MAG: hypothetical protein ACSHXY_08835 [Alphaproteobacteria bacterium]